MLSLFVQSYSHESIWVGVHPLVFKFLYDNKIGYLICHQTQNARWYIRNKIMLAPYVSVTDDEKLKFAGN